MSGRLSSSRTVLSELSRSWRAKVRPARPAPRMATSKVSFEFINGVPRLSVRPCKVRPASASIRDDAVVRGAVVPDGVPVAALDECGDMVPVEVQHADRPAQVLARAVSVDRQ